MSQNAVISVNIEHMSGADKRIEHYEQMVSDLFEARKMKPLKECECVGDMLISKPKKIASHNDFERQDGMSDKRDYGCLLR